MTPRPRVAEYVLYFLKKVIEVKKSYFFFFY